MYYVTHEVYIFVRKVKLNHKYWDRTYDGVSGLVEKYFYSYKRSLGKSMENH